MADTRNILLHPEEGYKRIDNEDVNIVYSGAWSNDISPENYNGSCKYSKNGIITFIFCSSKLRILGSFSPTQSTHVQIEIDDNLYSYSCRRDSIQRCSVLFDKTLADSNIHVCKITNVDTANDFTLDCIDIDDDGYLLTREEYEELLQKSKDNFPVKIGGESIVSETNVANYCATLVNGERQLLVSDKLNGIYLTDGQGGYIKIIDENTTNHINREVLDLLSTDGESLYFNGKNIQKIELEDGQYGYSATFMNVVADSTYSINIDKGSKLCDQIVQVWEFEEGTTDLTTIAKTFNNHATENFFYDDNIDFTDEVCKVKDEYVLENTLNSEGFYETKLNKTDFIELIGLTSEVNE